MAARRRVSALPAVSATPGLRHGRERNLWRDDDGGRRLYRCRLLHLHDGCRGSGFGCGHGDGGDDDWARAARKRNHRLGLPILPRECGEREYGWTSLKDLIEGREVDELARRRWRDCIPDMHEHLAKLGRSGVLRRTRGEGEAVFAIRERHFDRRFLLPLDDDRWKDDGWRLGDRHDRDDRWCDSDRRDGYGCGRGNRDGHGRRSGDDHGRSSDHHGRNGDDRCGRTRARPLGGLRDWCGGGDGRGLDGSCRRGGGRRRTRDLDGLADLDLRRMRRAASRGWRLRSRGERRCVRRARHVVAELLRRVDRATTVVGDVDREARHSALVTSKAAGRLQGALPRLGLYAIVLRGLRAIERADIDDPAHARAHVLSVRLLRTQAVGRTQAGGVIRGKDGGERGRSRSRRPP